MTVSALTRRVSYTGNGITTSFAVPFQFFEIAVALDGAPQTQGVHFSIVQTTPGAMGSITMVTAPIAPKALSIVGNTSKIQGLDLVDNDSAPAETYELALDRLTMALQETSLGTDRTVRAPNSSAALPEINFATNPNSYLLTDAYGVPFLATVSGPGSPFYVPLTSAVAAAASASTDAATATSQRILADAAAASALLSYDSFDDRYLGPKAAAPALDNDGNTLLVGALYFDTVGSNMRVWNGSAWNALASSATGTVTNVATGVGLTGGPISSAGTVSMANMASLTLKGNAAGVTAAPADLTAAQARTLLGLATVATTGAAANVSGLATVATSGSAADLGGTLSTARLPGLVGDVTAGLGSNGTTIAANVVTNAKLASVAQSSIKGRVSGGTGNSEDLNGAQVNTILPVATTALAGTMSAADKVKLNAAPSVNGVKAGVTIGTTAVNFASSADGSIFTFNRPGGSLDISRDGTNFVNLVANANATCSTGTVYVGNGRAVVIGSDNATYVNVGVSGSSTVRFKSTASSGPIVSQVL